MTLTLATPVLAALAAGAAPVLAALAAGGAPVLTAGAAPVLAALSTQDGWRSRISPSVRRFGPSFSRSSPSLGTAILGSF